MHSLQNEWDALVLETYTLRQQYNSTRQELSYALYAQDAANRVVARLIKERDAARESVILSFCHNYPAYKNYLIYFKTGHLQVSLPPWACPETALEPMLK